MTRSKGPVPDTNTDAPEPRKTRKSTRQTIATSHKRKASISNEEAQHKGVKKPSHPNNTPDNNENTANDLTDHDNEDASARSNPKSSRVKKAANPKSAALALSSSKSKAIKPSSAKPQAAASNRDAEEDDTTTPSSPSYWLMKAEPESRIENGVDVKFSIDDLAAKKEPEAWDGVRNYVARNNMRAMRKGELAFFYHSNCKIPGIAGVMEVVGEHEADESAFDISHPYYDPKSNRENPKWSVVHVKFRAKFDEFIPLKKLQEFKNAGDALASLQLLKQSRLSVSKVTSGEWEFICGLSSVDPVTLDSIG